MAQDYLDRSPVLKFIIVGESGVGKTAISWKFVDGRFIENHKATIGADLLTKEIKINNRNVLCQLWDTAGQERFQSMSNAFWRGANACLLIYDISDKESFESIDKWRNKLLNIIDPDSIDTFPLLLIGNKSDLDHIRKVSISDGKRYATQNRMLFYEASAKTGLNIESSINELARKTIKLQKFDIPHFEPATGGDEDLWMEELQELEEFQKQQQNACICQLI